MADSASLTPLFEALRRNAKMHPERDAYIWYGQHISWQQMDDYSDAVAAHLQQLGVKKGEPALLKAVNDELLKLESTGQAAKIYDVWFGPETKSPQARAFKIEAK